MAQLLKDGGVVVDSWQTVDGDLVSLPTSGDLLLTLTQWHQLAAQLPQHSGNIGILLDTDTELEDIPSQCLELPLIAIAFTKFADGRGFSLARLLRERYNYRGELRATGDILRDQLYLLKGCGFNSFQLSGIDLAESAASLEDFSEAYQGSVEQPAPLFKRR
jgi:uncharacterized protein (DUF934 family)